MTISIHADTKRRGGVISRVRHWLAFAHDNRAEREFSLENFNDHLLRDMGIRREPSRNQRRHLMRF